MNFRDVSKLLMKSGWIKKAQNGSHVQFENPETGEKITVPKHGKKDLARGTLNAILTRAGLK